MRIPFKIVLCGVLALQVPVSGETISGRVIDSITSAPIPNATVSLKDLGISTYTDINGNFALVFTPTGTKRFQEVKPSLMRFAGAKVFFSVDSRELITIDLYDISGRKISTLLDRVFDAGKHSLSLPALVRKDIGSGLYIVKIRKGNDDYIGTFLPVAGKNGTSASAENSALFAPGATWALAKAALPDSLPAYRMGYTRKVLTIASYTTQNVGDIRLYQTAEERTITRKVDSLLALMTINEKAGQMTQARKGQLTNAQIASLGIGSMFNGGGDPQGNNTPSDWAAMIDGIQDQIASTGPHKIPMVYGQDCVHGVGAVAGTTVFPHNIGLGCTNDTILLAKVGAVTASEAAGCGIRLNFAPCVASPRNEKWGRTYEGFGESPEINSSMGAAYTRGQQGFGVPSRDTAIAVCVKHSIGDGGTTNGANGTTTTLADSTMRAVHFAQYMACGREQMATIMPSYHAWARPGGVTFEQTRDSIAFRMLKKEAGLDGFAISDWDAVSTDGGGYNNTGIAQCINAGLDMAMIVSSGSVTTWINTIVSLAGSTIPQSRIDDAVRRILRIKFRFHIFDHPKSNATARAQIYSAAHQAIAREAVRKSLVLLKNTGSALPLTESERITVVGSFADNIGVQCGGWTISWQGQSGTGPGIAGETILSGMRSVGTSANITYNASGAGLVAANIDKIVVVVGESPYAEGQGDDPTNKTVDLTNVNGAGALITTCHNVGKPVIVVLLSGRPLIIDGELPNCEAFVAAWLPGSKGMGVADVLYGDYNFTGKLSHVWPASYAQIPINSGKVYSEEQKGTGGTPLYNYGYGLTY